MRNCSRLENYIVLNNSFKKKFVFRLGADSGFYSEYNNMILAILYCLKHRIKFVLNSNFANFKLENGYSDFFAPFCEEDNRWFHQDYNFRGHLNEGKKKSFKAQLFKHLYGIDYLTQDVWNFFRQESFKDEIFDIPALNICGNLLEATQVIIDDIVWRYNKTTGQAVNKRIELLEMPQEYVGLHIRAGDKFLEGDIFEPVEYISKAASLTQCRKAFILTDDYSIIEKLRIAFSDWEFYTLCDPLEKGFTNGAFLQQNSSYKMDKFCNLFASMDILTKSILFIGTFNSNPGMFLGMRLGGKKCIGMDREKWTIW